MSDIGQNPGQAPSDAASDPKEEILALVRTGKIPNGLLFTGAPGTGKEKAAQFLAQACNCSQGPGIPCGSCTACKKLASGMHPDFITIDPADEKKNITIAQIREMGHLISARPNEGRYRIILIRHADRMNVQAQNALLKSLEEPPARTVFILQATDAAPLLPTILSRCRRFRFRTVSKADACRTLERLPGIDPETAHILVNTLGSDPDRILERLGDPPTAKSAFCRRRKQLITRLTEIISGKAPGIFALTLSWQLSQAPEELSDALAVIRTVLRDLAVLRYDSQKIVNLDFFDTFADISQMVEMPALLGWTDRFHDTERRLASNSVVRLALDRFFLALSEPRAQTAEGGLHRTIQ